MNSTNGVLLESGTNELEILEFGVGHNKFGINVLKVREIINPEPMINVPLAHKNIEGIIEIRGEVLPVINLATVLGIPTITNNKDDKFIISEFNKQKIVFHVHSVTQIERITWEQIEKPSDIYQGDGSQVIGVIKLSKGMILLLDFEKIVVDINPELGINLHEVKKLGKRENSEKRLAIAEDSPLLRKLLLDTLNEAGFYKIDFFENGLELLSHLESIISSGKEISDEVQLVITDLEMPKMDGHHLIKRIKATKELSILPIIIFSSLISDDLKHKGVQVGANGQVSKPEIAELIGLIDRFIL